MYVIHYGKISMFPTDFVNTSDLIQALVSLEISFSIHVI